MKLVSVVLLVIATMPLVAADVSATDDVVLQVIARDLDRDDIEDRATLVRRGDRHYLILEKGGYGEDGRREIFIHPMNYPNPKIVYSEYARYLILGDSGVRRRSWVLWDRGEWGMLADSSAGIGA